MLEDRVLILSLFSLVILASGCSVSTTTHTVTNPKEPNPVILNMETEMMSERTPKMEVENIDDGVIDVKVKNRGKKGFIGTVLIFEDDENSNLNSTTEIKEFEKGEEKTVTLEPEIPEEAETYYIFVSDSQIKS